MVVVISRFKVRNGMEEEVRQAFLRRPRLVEKAPGFCGLDVLTEGSDPSIFLLLTRWTDEESFRTWHRSESHLESYSLIPEGLKLDASFTSVTIAHSIEDHAAIQNVSDAVLAQPAAVAQLLTSSDSVFAVLFAPDGNIRARNRAAMRILDPDSAPESGATIWDYLVVSDAEKLRQRLSQTESPETDSFLLNLAQGANNPVTCEVSLVHCVGAFLLLGVRENRHDGQFQAEVLRLTNDLSIAMRETTRKNRALQMENETMRILASMDDLTGLATREMLEEALHRETARTRRKSECLSLVFADLDDFKLMNERFGHAAGDRILARLGEIFNSRLRTGDMAIRFGGDEFVLLLPDTTRDAAVAIAERLRVDVESLHVPECPCPMTISVGVASWMAGDGDEKLVACADAAHSRAKGNGGNRVEAV
jgi:diguanylate cyclase (GGDEF)-like protein